MLSSNRPASAECLCLILPCNLCFTRSRSVLSLHPCMSVHQILSLGLLFFRYSTTHQRTYYSGDFWLHCMMSSSVAAGNSRAIQFHLETIPGWAKHEQQFPSMAETSIVKLPAIARTVPSQGENDEEEWDTLLINDKFLEIFNISGSNALDESDHADPRAKDFLMQRFLRAAKAIASKAPPHSSKKMLESHKQPKCATMTGKAAAPIPAHESRTYFETEEEQYDEDNMNDDGQMHTFCPFQEQGILSQARGNSVHRAIAKSPKAPNTVFKDMKGCTETYSLFHEKRKIVPSKKSTLQELMYPIKPTPQVPLPPSDSWLNRTLPSISSGKDLMQSYHNSSMPKQHCKNNQADPEQNRVASKWETMVKTSNLQRGHQSYSSSVL